MDRDTIIRAWKDAAFREGLGDDARAALPAHPAGMIELSDADLLDVAGGQEESAPTISILLTVYASCSDCDYTLDGGTCALGSFGCCIE